jgi:hypothetical protein
MSQEAETEKPSETSPSDNAATLPAATPDQKPDETKVEADETDAVMDRLTGGDQQKKTEEAPEKEESSEDEPVKKDEDKAPEEPEAEDFDHTKLDPEEEKGMNPRTKKRIDKFLAERQEMAPLATWGAEKISRAAKAGVKHQDLEAGINLVIGFLAGDPEADKQLVAAVKSAGLIKDTPAAAPNYDRIKSEVNRLLKVDYAISEDAHAAIMKALEAEEIAAKPKEPEPKAAPPKQEEAPQNQQAHFQKAVIANVSQRIQKMEAQYEAKHGPAWKDIHKAAYEKVAAWEKKMAPEERNDVLLYPARLAEAVSEVVHERSSKKSAIRPSNNALRPTNPPPTNVKRLEPGTEEYDLALLGGQITSDDE